MVPATWPIANVNELHDLYATYGQWCEDNVLGIRFHEGIDVVADEGLAVLAVEAGTIAALPPPPDPNNPPPPYESFISVRTTLLTGWNYIHVVPDPELRTGQAVQAGDVLGHVAAAPAPAAPHVHLDRTSGNEDTTWPPLLRPADDPLAELQPNNETTTPRAVFQQWEYRIADHDRFGVLEDVDGNPANPSDTHVKETERTDNLYFRSTTAYRFDRFMGGEAKVVGNFAVTERPAEFPPTGPGPGSANIDIIAVMWDRFTGAPGPVLGVKTVMFSITGHKWGGQTGLVTSFHFGYGFLGDPTEHTYQKLRTFNLVRVVYSHDAVANSTPGAGYFYTLTNKDDDTKVEESDLQRYWRSRVQKGNAWNDIYAAGAANNANCEFQDDFYMIRVVAIDNAGNEDSHERVILLNNWIQIRTGKDVYQPNEVVVESFGEQYSGNQVLPLYVLRVDPGNSGNILSDMQPVLITSTTTDSNGNALPKDLGVFPVGSYWLVADYDQDGIWHRDLDAVYPFRVEYSGFMGPSGAPGEGEDSGKLDALKALPGDGEATQTTTTQTTSSGGTTEGRDGATESAATSAPKATTPTTLEPTRIMTGESPTISDIDRYFSLISFTDIVLDDGWLVGH